jgi:hypothetical protein
MTSKKVSSSHSVPSLTARILKTAGVIITLAALLDMFILPLPYQFAERSWQISLVTAWVERGIVPLVGIVLFLVGFAVEGGGSREKKAVWQDPRFWACVLASVLGLLYVLMFPFHLNNVRLANESAIEQVNQQAAQAETELNEQLNQEIESRRQQINQLLTASDSQLAELVEAGQLTQEQANLIKGFKANPSSVEPFLEKQEGDLRTEVQTEIGVRKQKAQSARKTEDLKSGLRIGLGSLLLAIGFITVGWTGLKNLRQS